MMINYSEIIKKEIKNFIDVFSPLLIGILITSISLTVLGPYMASKHQVYNDIILENTALSGTNKSGEFFSFWVSLFLGTTTIMICTYLRKNILGKSVNRELVNYRENISKNFDFFGIGVLFFPMLLILLITQKLNIFYLILSIIYFLSYILIDKKIKKWNFVLLFLSLYFFLIAIKVILDKVVKNYEIITSNNIYFITILLFFIIFYYLRKTNFKNLYRTILLFQIPIPLILLIFLTNKYLLNNTESYEIHFSKRYVIIIISIILMLFLMNIFQYKKKIREINNKKNRSLVMFSSIIIVFIIHHYVMPIYYHSGDFWHWGEEVLPWHQLINKHMSLYREYSGTSGLYGMVLGFFQNFVFHGTEFSYLPSLVLTNIFWVSLYAFLCYLLVGSNFSFIIALLTFLPEYNRINVLIIFFLLLSNTSLIKRRIQWIQVYLLISILSVFYYPLNGVAGILGGLPFAIIQIYLIYKEKLYSKVLKDKFFWLLNILLVYPIVIGIKYGLKIINLILLFSSQTKLADGTTAYGESIPPEWFMRFILDINLRNKLWYIFIFLTMILIILLFVYLLSIYMLKKMKIIDKLKNPSFFILTFFVIAVPINYTFTIVRLDKQGLFGRTTATMMVTLTFGLLIFLYKYGNKILSKNLKIVLMSFCIALVMLLQDRPPTGPDIRNLVTPQVLGDEVKNVKKNYKLNNVVYVDGEKEGIPELGKGFISKEKIEYLKIYKEMKEKLVKKDEYFWPLWNRELIKIFNSKVPTKIDSPYLTKSLKATNENLASMKEKPIFITDILNYQSYYTFRWIIDNGYVMYRYKGIDFWIRPDRYQEIFGDIENARKNMMELFPSQEIAKIPYSLGNSIQTLDKRFDKKYILNLNDTSIVCNQISKIDKEKLKIIDNKDPFFIINLSKNISGKDFDFIYIELTSSKIAKDLKDKKMQLFWESKNTGMSENRTIRFDYGNGKFLIPVGIHPAWTNSNITKLRLDFEGFEKGIEFKIKEIKFLKLNLDMKS